MTLKAKCPKGLSEATPLSYPIGIYYSTPPPPPHPQVKLWTSNVKLPGNILSIAPKKIWFTGQHNIIKQWAVSSPRFTVNRHAGGYKTWKLQVEDVPDTSHNTQLSTYYDDTNTRTHTHTDANVDTGKYIPSIILINGKVIKSI